MALNSQYLFVILSLLFALCSTISYSIPCSSSNDHHCNPVMNIGKEEVEDDGQAVADQHKGKNSSLQNPDPKLPSTPRNLWKGQTGWYYSTLLRHVHGVLNMIGWGTFMPTGVLIARYSREFPMRCEEWYTAHILCQTCGYVMGIIGWAFGISLGKSSKHSFKAFLILGILIIILTTIQMLAIYVQPKKESERRRCWEMYHHILGYVIIILIIANIFEGIEAQHHPEKWRWVYVGILSFLGFVAAALEITRCIKIKMFKNAMKLNADMYSPT